jgi:fluoride ion exporter CrcB/FEX
MAYLVVPASGGEGSLARCVENAAIMRRFDWSPPVAAAAGHRFLGGYTTFSSFEYESLQARRQEAKWMGLSNLVGSVVAGHVAVWPGAVVAERS